MYMSMCVQRKKFPGVNMIMNAIKIQFVIYIYDSKGKYLHNWAWWDGNKSQQIDKNEGIIMYKFVQRRHK